jgi:hypothetical protein
VSHRYQVYLPAKYSRARQAFSTDAYRYPERFAATQLPEWATRRAGGQGIA